MAGTHRGTGNIDDDPLFVDPTGGNPFPEDDFRIRFLSPCVDVGNNADVPAGLTTDLDANPRIVDGDGDDIDEVDMGAYEFVALANVDCDDGDVCTFDCAENLECTNDDTNRYGDVARGTWCGHPPGCGPSGKKVDLDDILAVIAAFGGNYADGCELHNYDIASPPCPGACCFADELITLDDITAVLNAFEGCDPCCGGGGCSEGAPSSPSRTGSAGEAVALELELRAADPSAPQTIQVDIFAGAASDLRGYQITLSVAGDVAGNVTLEGFYVDTTRPDYIFNEIEAEEAFDTTGRRFAVVRYTGGSTVTDRAYLGTCVLHVADGATGIAQISLDPTGGTMLRDSFSLPVDVILPDAMDLILP